MDPKPSSSPEPNGADASPAPRLEITTSRQFVSWLAEAGSSLAFTTYQSGNVFLIGSNREAKRLSIFERTLDRPISMPSALAPKEETGWSEEIP